MGVYVYVGAYSYFCLIANFYFKRYVDLLSLDIEIEKNGIERRRDTWDDTFSFLAMALSFQEGNTFSSLFKCKNTES